MEITLPKPNEHELSKWNKADYYKRIYTEYSNLATKYKLESQVFVDWVHHTYETWIRHDRPLTFNQYKKLIR